MTMKWMLAAVKRILVPGCKFDNMLVLQGGQGIGKSTMCERLSKGFCSSLSLSEIGNKDIFHATFLHISHVRSSSEPKKAVSFMQA